MNPHQARSNRDLHLEPRPKGQSPAAAALRVPRGGCCFRRVQAFDGGASLFVPRCQVPVHVLLQRRQRVLRSVHPAFGRHRGRLKTVLRNPDLHATGVQQDAWLHVSPCCEQHSILHSWHQIKEEPCRPAGHPGPIAKGIATSVHAGAISGQSKDAVASQAGSERQATRCINQCCTRMSL